MVREVLQMCMNPPPRGASAYRPTAAEQLANSLTHGLGIVPAVFGTGVMLQQAHSTAQMVSALVFGSGLVLLLLASTSFHLYCLFYWQKGWFHVLQLCDRSSIYFYIAASYTPWITLLDMPESMGVVTSFLMWLLAALGTLYSCLFLNRNKALETALYVVMGFAPALPVLSAMKEFPYGTHELAYGGAAYMLGVILFKGDGKIPFAHALWHICTLIGSSFHYYAIFTYLMTARSR